MKKKGKEMETDLNKKIDQLRAYHLCLENSLKEVRNVKTGTEEIKKQQMSLQGCMQVELSTAKRLIMKLKEESRKEGDKLQNQNSKLKEQLDSTNFELEVLKKNLQARNEQNAFAKEIQEKLEVVKGELNDHKKENMKIVSEKNATADALQKMKAMLR